MAERITITLDNAALRRQTMPRLAHFLRSLTRRIEREAKDEVPTRTGRTRRAIEADPVRITGPWSLDSGVSVRVPYALFLHEGTRPHIIRPRRARALRFEVGGAVVFARRVHHPGTAARPFLRRAAVQTVAADPHIRRR